MKIIVYNKKNSELWTSAFRNAFPDADARHKINYEKIKHFCFFTATLRTHINFREI